MARNKIKIGDTVKFNFAGQPLIGVLIDITKTEYGTVQNIWYQVKHQDGTLYPCMKENLTLVNG